MLATDTSEKVNQQISNESAANKLQTLRANRQNDRTLFYVCSIPASWLIKKESFLSKQKELDHREVVGNHHS